MRRLIADEIGRVCQTIEIELSENHWMPLWLFNGGADQIAPFGEPLCWTVFLALVTHAHP
jgi:hypothetical protein